MQYQRPSAPVSVRIASALVFLQASLATLLALFIVLIGGLLTLAGGGLGAAGGVFIAIAVGILVLCGLWVWAGVAIVRLNNVARWIVVALSVLECLGQSATWLRGRSGISSSGILVLVLSFAVIYLLVFDSSARAAFAASSTRTATPPPNWGQAPLTAPPEGWSQPPSSYPPPPNQLPYGVPPQQPARYPQPPDAPPRPPLAPGPPQ